MRRIAWLAALAGLAAIALLLAFRGQALASDDGASCPSEHGFVPAFCLSVPSDAARRETSVPLASAPAVRADVRVDTAVAPQSAALLASRTDEQVQRLEELFGRPFSQRPRIYVFATPASFATGVHELFGYAAPMALYAANTYGGIFDRPTLTIAVNWSAGSAERMTAAIAHELTHLMLHEVSGGRAIPTWLDEGVATTIEQKTPGGSIWAAEEDLAGRQVASRVSLKQLDALADWHAVYTHLGRPLYAYAANAVRAVEARVGWHGLIDVLANVSSGATFEQAYEQAAGESLSDLADRVVAGAGAGIVARIEPSGGARWTLFAGSAGPIEITITGPNGYRLSFTAATDRRYMYTGTFGGTAAPGEYTVSAAGVSVSFVTSR